MQHNPIVILFTAPSPACLERLVAWLVPSRGGGAASLFSLLLLQVRCCLLSLSLLVDSGGQGTINPLLLRDVAFLPGLPWRARNAPPSQPSGGKTLGTGSITGSSQAARNAINLLIRLQPRLAFISLPLVACSSRLVFSFDNLQ